MAIFIDRMQQSAQERWVLDTISELGSGSRKKFTGENARLAAEQTAQDQKRTHEEIINIAIQMLKKGDLHQFIKGEISPFATDYFAEFAKISAKAVKDGDGWTIETAPSGLGYSQDDVDSVRDIMHASLNLERDAKERDSDAVAILAMMALNMAPVRNVVQSDRFPRLSVLFSEQIARIKAYQEASARPFIPLEAADEISAKIDNSREEVRKLAMSIVERETELKRLFLEIEHAKSELADIREPISDLKEFQANEIAAIREQLKLEQARKLWGTVCARAQRDWKRSAYILGALLIGTPIAIFVFQGQILSFFKAIEDTLVADAPNHPASATIATLARLIIFSAPLGFVIWAARLVVRYNTRSMLLADDAAARVTMLDTFLFMIEQGASTAEDRGAILEALFRRSPGHGGDSAEPPNFVELMKYGKEKSG